MTTINTNLDATLNTNNEANKEQAMNANTTEVKTNPNLEVTMDNEVQLSQEDELSMIKTMEAEITEKRKALESQVRIKEATAKLKTKQEKEMEAAKVMYERAIKVAKAKVAVLNALNKGAKATARGTGKVMVKAGTKTVEVGEKLVEWGNTIPNDTITIDEEEMFLQLAVKAANKKSSK